MKTLFTEEQLDEIAELIDLALTVARKNFRNDGPTIDDVQNELFDAFDLWEDENED